MYGYGYRYNSGLVVSAGGGAPFANTKSLSFDGMDDYVDTNSPFNSLLQGTNFTVSLWFNSSVNTSYYTLISNGYPFQMYFVGNKIKIWMGYPYFLAPFESVSTLSLSTWYHIAFIKSGNNWLLYINGSLDNSVVNSGTVSISTNNLTIGKFSSGAYFFQGNIDEVSIFDTDQSSNIATLSTAPTVDLTSLNPLAWYRNGDNGSWKSPQWLIPNNENKDKISNYSLDFDGVDDYLNIANNTTIGRTQNISYSVWVNLDVTTRQYIIGNISSSNGGCGLAIEGGDVLVFQMGDGGNDSYFNSRVANFSTYAPINTWNHILATWDGTDSKIYINGVLRNTWSPTLPYTIISYNAFTIGWRSAGFTFMTNARLDELALFNSGISIGDVWDGSGQPIDVSAVSGITNYWKMGDNSTFLTNWTVPDEVGIATGTSANMTIEDRIGEAPNSTNNALSLNMDFADVVSDVPN